MQSQRLARSFEGGGNQAQTARAAERGVKKSDAELQAVGACCTPSGEILYIGSKVMAADEDGDWAPARIENVRADSVLVSFGTLMADDTEWIALTDAAKRLKPPGSVSPGRADPAPARRSGGQGGGRRSGGAAAAASPGAGGASAHADAHAPTSIPVETDEEFTDESTDDDDHNDANHTDINDNAGGDDSNSTDDDDVVDDDAGDVVDEAQSCASLVDEAAQGERQTKEREAQREQQRKAALKAKEAAQKKEREAQREQQRKAALEAKEAAQKIEREVQREQQEKAALQAKEAAQKREKQAQRELQRKAAVKAKGVAQKKEREAQRERQKKAAQEAKEAAQTNAPVQPAYRHNVYYAETAADMKRPPTSEQADLLTEAQAINVGRSKIPLSKPIICSRTLMGYSDSPFEGGAGFGAPRQCSLGAAACYFYLC